VRLFASEKPLLPSVHASRRWRQNLEQSQLMGFATLPFQNNQLKAILKLYRAVAPESSRFCETVR
jgi:hypothetical protein